MFHVEQKGGEPMNMVEIMELLKNILEILDKIYHATIGEDKDDAKRNE